jgi:hypothetical protein
MVGYRLAADQMLLDDALQNGRVAGAVPCALGIDNRDRATLANTETVGLCSKDAALIGNTSLRRAYEVVAYGQR